MASRTPAALRVYTEDYAGWVEDTARAIEEGRFEDIDRAALADEVRDLGKTERREITSAFCILLTHLLKVKYQPAKRSRNWDAANETGLDIDTFPETCEWTIEEVLA